MSDACASIVLHGGPCDGLEPCGAAGATAATLASPYVNIFGMRYRRVEGSRDERGRYVYEYAPYDERNEL
jgi:hypothetical protein